MMKFEHADDPDIRELPGLAVTGWILITLLILPLVPVRWIALFFVVWNIGGITALTFIDKAVHRRRVRRITQRAQERKDAGA